MQLINKIQQGMNDYLTYLGGSSGILKMRGIPDKIYTNVETKEVFLRENY